MIVFSGLSWLFLPKIALAIALILSTTSIQFLSAISHCNGGITIYNCKNKAFVTHRVTFSSLPRPGRSSQHTSIYGIPKDKILGPNSVTRNEGSLLSKIWSSIKSVFLKKPKNIRTVNFQKRHRCLKNTHPYSSASEPPSSCLKSMNILDLPDRAIDRNYSNDNTASPQILPTESPYDKLLRFTPSEILTKFMDMASPRVKEAVRMIVGSLVGSFYRYSIETTLITTTDRLAALIYNLQMTGYMLCNAESRYCLSQHFSPASKDLEQNIQIADTAQTTKDPSVSQIHAAVNKPEDNSVSITSTVENYEGDLLSYIKRLPEEHANGLFDYLTTDVIDAMKTSSDTAIESLTAGMVGNGAINHHNTRMIIQQTGTSAMQLCFWQLALGYCFRDLEAKIELNEALNRK